MPPETKAGHPLERSELVLIGLGSNLGNSKDVLSRAAERLQSLASEPLDLSSLWESEPVDCPPGSPPFLNAAIGLRGFKDLSPEVLLETLQRMERETGRSPKKQLNEARILDLDIIAYGAREVVSERLTLPHPRAHLRRFVLAPLAELVPDLILPGQIQTVQQLLDRLPLHPTARRVERFPAGPS